MKRLNTDSTTSDVGLVLQHKHLDFLQDKTEESLIHAIYALLGYSSSSAIVLYGCVPTFSTTTTTNDTLAITAGAVSYQGKTYEVSASSVVKIGSNVHLLKLSTVTYDVSDPSLFTDNISRDVQEIRKVELGQGASGSGIGNWSSIVRMQSLERYATWVNDYLDNTKRNYSAVIDIGTWNMQTTPTILIPFPTGIIRNQIVRVSAWIYSDDGTVEQDLNTTTSSSDAAGYVQVISGNIKLDRGTIFATSNYSVSSNRGKLYIDLQIDT